jgi:hypothetical protein
MPKNVSIKRVIATVNALAKLHNFCINQTCLSDDIPQSLEKDSCFMMNKDDGYIDMISDKEHDTSVPIELMNVGHHYDEVPKAVLKRHNALIQQDKLPRSEIHDFIPDGHWERPQSLKRSRTG